MMEKNNNILWTEKKCPLWSIYNVDLIDCEEEMVKLAEVPELRLGLFPFEFFCDLKI